MSFINKYIVSGNQPISHPNCWGDNLEVSGISSDIDGTYNLLDISFRCYDSLTDANEPLVLGYDLTYPRWNYKLATWYKQHNGYFIYAIPCSGFNGLSFIKSNTDMSSYSYTNALTKDSLKNKLINESYMGSTEATNYINSIDDNIYYHIDIRGFGYINLNFPNVNNGGYESINCNGVDYHRMNPGNEVTYVPITTTPTSIMDLPTPPIHYYDMTNRINNNTNIVDLVGSSDLTLWNIDATNFYNTDGINGDYYVASSTSRDVSESLDFNNSITPSNHTFNMWVKPSPQDSVIFKLYEAVDEFSISYSTSGYRLNKWNGTYTGSSAYFGSGDWDMLTITTNNDVATFYINGVLKVIFSLTDMADTYNGVSFAGNPANYIERAFVGKMDEIAIFDTILSQNEINVIYDNRLFYL